MAGKPWKHFMSFQECRAFIQSLGLKSTTELQTYLKSKDRPADVPRNPYMYYRNNGWISYTDFIGRKPQCKKSFEDFKLWVQEQNIVTPKQFFAATRPKDIPSNPDEYYKEEWTGWPDALRNGAKPFRFLLFNEARSVAWSKKFTKQNEWYAFAKTDEAKQLKVPFSPDSVYENEWISWPDWLGFAPGKPKQVTKKDRWPFDNARILARSLNLKSCTEWFQYCTSGKKPRGVPRSPNEVYTEWVDWADWLGADIKKFRGRNCWRSYEDAKLWARLLHLKSKPEWDSWIQNHLHEIPEDIPTNPETVYGRQLQTWKGWYDFLGATTYLSKQGLEAMVREMLSNVNFQVLDDTEAWLIVTALGKTIPARLMRNLQIADMSEVIRVLKQPNAEEILVSAISQSSDCDETDYETDDSLSQEIRANMQDIRDSGREVTTESILALDQMANFVKPDDLELIIGRRLRALRTKYIHEGEAAVSNLFKTLPVGPIFQRIRDTILNEFKQLRNICCPQWQMKINGEKKEPNGMQKYTALRLAEFGKWFNWSGVGSGKTASAGLASFHIGSQLTVVIANNSTVGSAGKSQWENELKKDFAGVNVYFEPAQVKKGLGAFLILNYERFQIKSAARLIDDIAGLEPDMLVFDEAQCAKHRTDSAARASLRRSNLIKLRERIPRAKILVMSATPVLNDLSEGVSLLQLGTEEPISAPTKSTISNCVNLHHLLFQHGLRYQESDDKRKISRKFIEIEGDHLFHKLTQCRNLIPGTATRRERYQIDIPAVEGVLLQSKLEAIKDHVKKGAIVFSYYTKNIIPKIESFLRELGFTVAVCTGDNPGGKSKDRLLIKNQFETGECDVLLGSSVIATGVDGLQKISDRLIIISPPWTSANMEQLEGRIDRSGSQFSEIEIIVPQVTVKKHDGTIWSWDKQRYSIVESKRDLSAAAVDGTLPLVDHINQNIFAQQAMEALGSSQEIVPIPASVANATE